MILLMQVNGGSGIAGALVAISVVEVIVHVQGNVKVQVTAFQGKVSSLVDVIAMNVAAPNKPINYVHSQR